MERGLVTLLLLRVQGASVFTGEGPHVRDYRRGATINIEKGIGAKYVELEITDKVTKQQPEFVIKEWE